jgi:hypothetical protein
VALKAVGGRHDPAIPRHREQGGEREPRRQDPDDDALSFHPTEKTHTPAARLALLHILFRATALARRLRYNRDKKLLGLPERYAALRI